MGKSLMVSIIMGSKNDDDYLRSTYELLDDFGVAWEKRVLSAHRQSTELTAYIGEAEKQGVRVFIAAAGLSAALPGVIAAHSIRPVIGVPIPAGPLNGVDALLSIVQMPGGIPVAAVGLGTHGPKNAAILAVEFLALSDDGLAEQLQGVRDKMRG